MPKPKNKSKSAAQTIVAPQSREEAASYVRQIGDMNRCVARLEADMNDQIAKLKERAELEATPIAAAIGQMTEGLRVWCEANRQALTDGGNRKTADLGTGKVEWRIAPPKVTIRGVDDVIAAIKRLGLLQFIRTKEEIDKEAMLREPDQARLAPGVSIGSDGETFAVEPFEAALTGGES